MALLDRHRVSWTGFAGAPGVSTFYCVTGVGLNAPLHTFFDAIKGLLPADVNLQVETTGDTIDSATGTLSAAWSDVPQALVAGTDTHEYSAVTGSLVMWATSTFLSGRRLRGHTFLVPFGGHNYDTSGEVEAGAVSTITGAATALITVMSGNLMLWQRPRAAAAAYTDRRGVVHPAITSRIGGYGPVDTGTCRRLVTELRSRRD